MPHATSAKKASAPTCTHNSWDNVRVIKGHVTLRCRECQDQWRTAADTAWRRRKCTAFPTLRGCPSGDACPKLHIHSKKQSLTERVDRHGGPYTRLPAKNATGAIPPAALSTLVIDRVSCFERVHQHSHASSDLDYGPNDVDSTSRSRRTSTASHTPDSECLSGSQAGGDARRVSYEMPCEHNNWANVRVKKGLVTLRCTVCQEQWRQVSGTLNKCPDFPRCPNLFACNKVHLHCSKKSILAFEQVLAEHHQRKAAGSALPDEDAASEVTSSTRHAEQTCEVRWCDEELDAPLPAFDDFVQQAEQKGHFLRSAGSPATLERGSDFSDAGSSDANDFSCPARALTPLSFTADEQSAFPTEDDAASPSLWRCNTGLSSSERTEHRPPRQARLHHVPWPYVRQVL
ncbi:hypothetical protein DIPPA_04437 [Diplonema papillatum]|nr:hypothetical protein DIPPA_04437 [Diplonema papillatum]